MRTGWSQLCIKGPWFSKVSWQLATLGTSVIKTGSVHGCKHYWTTNDISFQSYGFWCCLITRTIYKLFHSLLGYREGALSISPDLIKLQGMRKLPLNFLPWPKKGAPPLQKGKKPMSWKIILSHTNTSAWWCKRSQQEVPLALKVQDVAPGCPKHSTTLHTSLQDGHTSCHLGGFVRGDYDSCYHTVVKTSQLAETGSSWV